MPGSMVVMPVLVAAGLLFAARAQAQAAPPASGVYTCIDAKGRKLTSDRPIPECIDREQKVLNPSGTVQTKVGPTLSAQERAEAEAKQKQAADAAALVAEERRRDRALLVRYPTKEVHDQERAAALDKVRVVVLAANNRIVDLQSDRRRLDQEMEFYKKDPSKAPASLRRQMEEIDQSLAVQTRFIGDQDKEIQRVNARFDDELARLKPLWQAQANTRPIVAKPAKTP